MNSPSRTALKWILSISVSAVALYFAVRGVDWPTVWRTIATARWIYLLAGAGIVACTSFLRGIRWRILLNAEANLDVGTVFWANMAGYLGNNFLPARAGEVIRSLLVSSRSSLSRTYVLTTALGERMVDAITLVLCASVVLLGVRSKPAWMEKASGTMAIAAAAGALAIMILPHTGNLVKNVTGRIPMPQALRIRLAKLAEQVLLGLRAFHNWGRFAGFAFLTAVIWTGDSCNAMVLGRALGVELTFPVALLLITCVGLSSALPSTPGYVGVFQFAVVSVLAPFGIARDAALAYSLVYQVVGYLVVLALGLPGVYILQGRSALRALSSANSASPIL